MMLSKEETKTPFAVEETRGDDLKSHLIATTFFQQKMGVAITLFLVAVVLITFCSKSSPLYPFNDWVDANCFFTVGKSMVKGLVPYRDLWEQKGPFLYMLHAFASLVSYRTFFGVYLLEVLTAFGFLWYGYRACRVLTNSSGVLAFLPLIGAMVFSSLAFKHGDSVEELALAPLAYALYLGLLVVERKQLLSFWQALSVGITAGMVFWSKFTLVGLYVGWILAVVWVTGTSGGIRAFARLVGGIFAGWLLVTVPILIYFIANGALSDLFQDYFFSNLFSYSNMQGEGVSLLSNLRHGYAVARKNLGAIIVGMGALGFLWTLIYRPLHTFVHLVAQAFFMFFFIYVGGRFYVYYPLPLSLFAIIGCAALSEWSDVFWQRFARRPSPQLLSGLAILLAFGYAYFSTPNAYLRTTPREEMPQYRFAEQIAKKTNPTLLNYGFLDGGFYTVLGIVPNIRAFCTLNLPSTVQVEEQDAAIRERRVDFIVTRGDEREFDGYRLIDRTDFFFEGPQHYALYEKIEE